MRRAILLLLMLSSLLLITQHSASQELFVDVEGPAVMPVGGDAQFNVSAVGGPAAEGGTFRITAYLMGDNLTGAIPNPSQEFENETTEPNWVINVTAPGAAQTVTLLVNVTSEFENESSSEIVETKIKVVEPIVLSAEISNSLEYELREIPIDFYVKGPNEENDVLVGSTTIEAIRPGESEFASYDWIVGDPTPGRYRLTVVIDLNRDGVIDTNAGDSVSSSYFYVGGGVNILTYLLAVLLALLIVLSIIWLRRRPRRR
jgi:hypothetical protein